MISGWLNRSVKGRVPNLENISKLASALHCTVGQLTGDEQLEKEPQKEYPPELIEMARRFDQLSDDDKALVEGILKQILDRRKKGDEDAE